jgi:hypothetical protein
MQAKYSGALPKKFSRSANLIGVVKSNDEKLEFNHKNSFTF